jgi:hypothetical protein
MLETVCAYLNMTMDLWNPANTLPGELDSDGKWQGFVGVVGYGQADLAISSLTFYFSYSQVH